MSGGAELSITKVKVLRLRITANSLIAKITELAPILVTIIDKKVVKIETSFLA